MANRLKIAVFISGGGTTLQNLIAKREAGALDVDFGLVVSSNPLAGGLQYTSEAGIESLVIEKRLYKDDPGGYSEAHFQPCRERGVQLVVMGGFLKHILIPADFEQKVINIHPSLIPSFCGEGMYGLRVHRAAIDQGVKVSGCSVHFVDNHYDNGPIILQRCCPVMEDDTAETLQARVFQSECEALPDAIRWFSEKFYQT